MSSAEFKNGPRMVNWIHLKERKLYKIVHTLSHTNEKRMQLFLQDNGLSLNGRTYILPNYPPKSWICEKRERGNNSLPVRIVYVGAIGMESLYIREFSAWVDRQRGQVQFDIYTNQETEELQKVIEENKYRFIDVKGYQPYEKLPAVLSKYDVGVILYKGHIPNYIYNAPNKLFEYWSCGLDVWFPEKMIGSLAYARTDGYPKLIPVDFEEIGKFDWQTAVSHVGLEYRPSDYYCEQIFDDFFRHTNISLNSAKG
jgi:hypothetical protein